jgi:cytochrome c-type biogenesis protein CcmH/NrfG
LSRTPITRSPWSVWRGWEGMYYRNFDPNPARLQRSKELAQRALGLDAGLAEGHVTIGAVYGYGYDYAHAAEEFREAVRLEPGDAYAWDMLAWALAYQQPPQGQAAEAAARESIRLQPSLAGAHYHLGRTLLVQGRYQEAVAAINHALELDPSLPSTYLGEVYLAQGDYGRAPTSHEDVVGRNLIYAYEVARFCIRVRNRHGEGDCPEDRS